MLKQRNKGIDEEEQKEEDNLFKNQGFDAKMMVDFYKSDPADKIMIAFKIHKMI